MKALVREDEIITEPFSPWVLEHLDWLTTPRPDGDGYTLIEDYEPPAEAPEETPEQEEAPTPEAIPEAPQEPAEEPQEEQEEPAPAEQEGTPAEAPQEAPETIIIDGVEYRRAGA